MVREAIAASPSRTSRSEVFADRYLEKTVQLPVTLPRLAPYDAEAYIGLLLAARNLPKVNAAAAHLPAAPEPLSRSLTLWLATRTPV